MASTPSVGCIRHLTPQRNFVAYPCRPSLEKGSASCLLIASVCPALATPSPDTVTHACRYPPRAAARGSRTASLFLLLPREGSCPDRLQAWPSRPGADRPAIHPACTPEQARRTEPPTSDHPFATGISWRNEMTTCTPVSAAAGAPCLPSVPAAPETLPKHLTSRCLTFSDPAATHPGRSSDVPPLRRAAHQGDEKSTIYGLSPRPPPWVTIA